MPSQIVNGNLKAANLKLQNKAMDLFQNLPGPSEQQQNSFDKLYVKMALGTGTGTQDT